MKIVKLFPKPLTFLFSVCFLAISNLTHGQQSADDTLKVVEKPLTMVEDTIKVLENNATTDIHQNTKIIPKSQEILKNKTTDTVVFEGQSANKKPKNEIIYSNSDVSPQFPGGSNGLRSFIKKELKYPPNALYDKIEGTAYVKFIIDKHGKIQNPKVIKGLSVEIDQEALRIVRKLPKFIPGMNNGKLVNVYYTLPILFKLN